MHFHLLKQLKKLEKKLKNEKELSTEGKLTFNQYV